MATTRKTHVGAIIGAKKRTQENKPRNNDKLRVIEFGGMRIPVQLQPLGDDQRTGLVLLDSRDLSPIGNQHYNKTTKHVVEKDLVCHGIQLHDKTYAQVHMDDLRTAMPHTLAAIPISATVPLGEIPAAYVVRSYALDNMSDDASRNAYALLWTSLHDTKLGALGRIVVATRIYPVLIVAERGGLTALLLRWRSEVKPRSAAAIDTSLSPAHVRAGKRLAKALQQPWEPMFADNGNQFQADTIKVATMRHAKKPIKALPGQENALFLATPVAEVTNALKPPRKAAK